MNRLLIEGNLTMDPKLSEIKKEDGSTVAVCSFSVACNSGYGERKKTTYVRVSTWANTAVACHKYLKKGSRVLCVGSAGSSGYINAEGKAVSSVEMRADEVEFLSSRRDDDEAELNF